MLLIVLQLRLIACSALLCLLLPSLAFAEVVPDATLPENTRINRQGNSRVIEGGTQRGNNLFHSFQEFSIPNDGIAEFRNSDTVANIFARVTGNGRSQINGSIQANGTANLFLLNPNGIVFGQNASLNIGGSFLATTAVRFNFADGTQFSAVDPQNSLLTVSVPVGLQFGQSPQSILNQSRFNLVVNQEGIYDYPVSGGLQVPPGQTLALLGGAVQFQGGAAIASGGQIELGSVAEPSVVGLSITDTGNWTFNYDTVPAFQDIQLAASVLGTTGDGGGRIRFQGRDIVLARDSQVSADTLTTVGGQGVEFNAARSIRVNGGSDLQAHTYGTGRAGDITIQAAETVELSDVAGATASNMTTIGSQVFAQASGEGGNITVRTRRLFIQDGAFISASTFGIGQAGDISIQATEAVSVLEPTDGGRDGTNSTGIFTQAEEGTGDGGDLFIGTRQLALTGGSFLSTATYTSGNSGNLNVTASDRIRISGIAPDAIRNVGRSGIFVSAEPGAIGNAGRLNISTGELVVDDRAEISANNRGTGSPGIARIDVDRLTVQNGGEIRASSARLDEGTLPDQGDGGALIINADSVQVAGSGTIGSETFPSAIAAFSETAGDAGDLQISTNTLTVQDGAAISVSGTSTGAAGNLRITANSLQLNRGSLIAETQAGSGAEISVRDADLLLLQNQSRISARANNLASGGNVTIIAPDGFVIALPDSNSDILANAVEGDGGLINITARSIIGFQERPEAAPTNDIDATSRFGESGTVTLNSFDVDPTQGLQPLATAPAPPPPLQGCETSDRPATAAFFNSGRGGSPPTPYDPLSSGEILDDIRPPADWAAASSTPSEVITPETLVEAQGWVQNETGAIVLTASAPADPAQTQCQLRQAIAH